MTLSELHVALLQAGISVEVCNAATEVMVRDGHAESWTTALLSSQVAKVLWLCFISSHEDMVHAESEMLKTRRDLPQQHGDDHGDTVIDFISKLVRHNSAATSILKLEADSKSRQLTAFLRDGDPIIFLVPGDKPRMATDDALTVGGMFISRAALAFASRVWLPFNQKVIDHASEN